MPISIQFPIEIGPEGFLSYTDDQTTEAINQNLKFLLLTTPQTFVGAPQFGVGIQKYLFSLASPSILSQAKSEILNQCRIYLPYLSILDISLALNEMVMVIKIQYRIDSTNEVEYFELVATELT